LNNQGIQIEEFRGEPTGKTREVLDYYYERDRYVGGLEGAVEQFLDTRVPKTVSDGLKKFSL
jgi:hypothetical protein